MKILVDAFGGDHSPDEILKGAYLAKQEYGVDIVLTGDAEKIKAAAGRLCIPETAFEIEHAPDVMPVEAEATAILKEYNNSSIAAGFKALAADRADAFVTAGSTGAFMVGSTMIVKRIKGIKRPALGTVIPCKDGCYMLIDCGANAECRPDMMVQFAIMGSAYMTRVLGVREPRVGLVNIGTEETKGNELQTAAYPLLKNAPVHFIGNIEARDIPLGKCDVAVTDGFTGNIILKLTEGFGSYFGGVLKGIFMASAKTKLGALLVKKGVDSFKKSMDYTEFGGAPLLGIAKPVIKAHGSSNAKAIKNAIRQAKECCEHDVTGLIAQHVESLKQQQ